MIPTRSMLAFLCLGGLAAAEAAVEPRRQTLVSVMSWHTPIGDLNGVRSWQAGGYRFERNRDGRSPANWRWPAREDLPPTLEPGSPAYLDLQEDAARQDLLLMAEAGFDVALFDMLPWPDWRPEAPVAPQNAPFSQFQTFERWLRSAEGLGIAVGLFADIENRSGDYPTGKTLDVAAWTASLSGALRLCSETPALWRIDGRPAIIHFGTSSILGRAPDPAAAAPDGGWGEILRRLRQDGLGPYFIADIRPHDPARQGWDAIADAVHCFHPAGPRRYLVEMQQLLARRHAVPYVWSTSIGYYNRKAWTAPDFRRIHEVYLAALAAGARFVHAMTWNDFAEDTDFAPSALKGRCLLDVYAYYNRWFTTGVEPAVWPERIIIGYPRAIPATVTSPSVSWGTPAVQRDMHRPAAEDLADPDWGDWRQGPYRPNLIWWARIDRPRQVLIEGVGQLDLPAGLSMGEFGSAVPGAMRIAVDDSGWSALPSVQATTHEQQGLQYRYHDLLHPDGREAATLTR